MGNEYTRRDAIAVLTASALGTVASTGSVHAQTTSDEPTLNRFATTARGAEITGIFLTADGRFFFNVQHPSTDNMWRAYDEGAVGALRGFNMADLPRDFPSVQLPGSEAQAELVRTAFGSHRTLAHGGDPTGGGERLGIPYTPDGVPMTKVDKTDSDRSDAYGNDPDFNGFVPSSENDNEGYLFTNWEDTPGLVSRLHLTRSGAAGAWQVREKMNVDFRPVEGTWNNCFGTVSPWNTPLTSEEYEPDAKAWYSTEATTFGNGEEELRQYLGYFGNPYRYGYIVEIEEPESDDPSPTKHHPMGRFSHENAVVMPDEKTAYMSDDGTGTVFFKFVADEAGDLSAGTLYAARANQESGSDPSEVGFELEWIELAHGTDEQIEKWIAEYDGQEPSSDPNVITDEQVTAWANGNAADDRVAFLESRKAAAAKGATDEFRKLEGVNRKRDAEPGDYLYLSVSEINETMLSNDAAADEFDDEQDHIQLKGNDYGAVYRMELEGDYNVSRMEPVVVGGPEANICGGCPYDADPNSKSEVCQDCSFNPQQSSDDAGGGGSGLLGTALFSMGTLATGLLQTQDGTVEPEEAIANPDNLVVMNDGRVIIGEDSGFHENNMIWVYDPADG
jgi:secreted PhoX family phosphatase